MVKMIYYLPDMHEFFKYFPTQNVMRQQNALLTNQVQPISFISEEQEEEEKKQAAGQNEGESAKTRSETQAVHKAQKQIFNSANPKLAEVSTLLPYLLCCLDFKVA